MLKEILIEIVRKGSNQVGYRMAGRTGASRDREGPGELQKLERGVKRQDFNSHTTLLNTNLPHLAS